MKQSSDLEKQEEKASAFISKILSMTEEEREALQKSILEMELLISEFKLELLKEGKSWEEVLELGRKKKGL